MKKMLLFTFSFIMLGWLQNAANNYQLLNSNIMHTVQEDGPYILYKNDRVYIKYILNDHGNKMVVTDSVDIA
ncbi:MAG: hypothetical protein ACRDEB_03470, partial [Chitinophagaceae bacterium]